MALPTDPEQVKQLGEAYKAIVADMKDTESALEGLSVIQHMQVAELSKYLQMLGQQDKLYQNQIDKLKELQKTLKEGDDTDLKKKQLELIDLEMKRLKEMKAMRDKYFKDRVEQEKFIGELQKKIRKEVDAQTAGKDADKDLERLSKDRTKGYQREIDTIENWRDVGEQAMTGLTSVGQTALKNFQSLEGDLAKLSLVMGTGFTMGALRLEAQAMFKSLESSWFNFVKETGLSTEELKLTYISIVDPLDAVRKELLDFEKVGVKPMTSIGLTGRDAQEAMVSLTNNVSYFRQSWVELNP